ncbi:MAG: hypothetical protein CEO12_320 [Parcubacteria group bacterium Gr01-1014_46]|nr:MAG: hypothetical protein CEO12_320 [Parcubacteria group bacterium Gr01-1014_46]
MVKLFDQDFFRFLLGFTAIVCTSLIILMASRLYQEESVIGGEDNAGAVIKAYEGRTYGGYDR